MAKKKIAAKSTELDAKEFFAAISDIEKDKGIPKAYMLEKITQALVAAYKRDHEGITDNVVVDANEELEAVRMFVKKDVVEAVDNPHTEISLDDAQRALPRAQLGDVLRIEIKPKNFGRIAAQTARQVIIQGMREAERGMVFDEFSAKEHEILTGSVTRVDERNGSVSIRLTSGSEFTDAFLSAGEQVKGEVIREGDRVRVYVVEVRRSTRGPQVLISRTHPGLVKRLFELEVPEIYDGLITIKKIVRIPGERAKVAVESYDERIDPVGACVGMKGSRIYTIVKELRNENIDVVNYTANTQLMIQRSLNPAKISSITLDEEKKTASVYLKPDQVSLAIGKGGLNIRLSKMLTGYDIDVYREVEEEDVALTEFADEIESWIIDALRAAGCDTAKSVLELPVEEIAARADLEVEQAQKVVEILKAEFEE